MKKFNFKSLALCAAMLSFSFAMNKNFADSNANQNEISKSRVLSSYKSPEESIENGLIDNIYYISVDMKLSQKYNSRSDSTIFNQYNYFIKLTPESLERSSYDYDRDSRHEDKFKDMRFQFSWADPSKKTRLNFTAKSGLLFDVCGYYEYYTPNSGHIYITNQNITNQYTINQNHITKNCPEQIIDCLTEESLFMQAMIHKIKHEFIALNDQLQNNKDFFKQNGIDRMKEFIKNQKKPNFFLSYYNDWSTVFGADDCIDVKNLYESFSNVGTQHIGPDLHEPKYPTFPINDDCFSSDSDELFPNVGTQHIGPELHEPKYPEFPINDDCFNKWRHSFDSYQFHLSNRNHADYDSEYLHFWSDESLSYYEKLCLRVAAYGSCEFNSIAGIVPVDHWFDLYGREHIKFLSGREEIYDDTQKKSYEAKISDEPKYPKFPINDDCFSSETYELFPNVGTQHIEPDLHGPKYPEFPINDDCFNKERHSISKYYYNSDESDSDSDNWDPDDNYAYFWPWPGEPWVKVLLQEKILYKKNILYKPVRQYTIKRYTKRRIPETSFCDIIETNNDIIDDENTFYLSNEEIINYARIFINYADIFGFDVDNVYEITFSGGGFRKFNRYHIDCIKLDNENLDKYKDIYIDKNVNNDKLQDDSRSFFPSRGTLQHFALEYKNLVFQGISYYFKNRNMHFRVAMRAYNKENLRLFDLRFKYYDSDRVSNSVFFSHCGIMNLNEEDNVFNLERILRDYQISEIDLILLLRSIINQTIPHDVEVDVEMGSSDIKNIKRSICTDKFNDLNNIYTIIERTTSSGYVKKFKNIANNDEFKIDKLVYGPTEYNIDNNILSGHIDFYGEYKNFNIDGVLWYKNARDGYVNVSNELTLKLSFTIGNMHVFYFPYSENSGHIEVDTCKYMKISELISISQEILKRLKPSEYRDNYQDRNMIINGIIKLMINQRGLQNTNEICKNFNKNITEYDIEIS